MKLLVIYPTITNWFFRNYLPIVLNQQSLSISLKHNPNISSNLSIEHQLLSLSTSFPQLFQKISAFVNTRIDWNETLESHMFKANLLGFKKEEVKVENLEIEVDRVLQISGERIVEKEDKNDMWHRVECNSGKFLKRFRLPENVKMVQVKASMENVVLIGAKSPDVKAVEISG